MIILKEAVLIRFGKFNNTTFKFNDGLQVLYGKNEAGKSTLQTFIKAMLYGVPSRRKPGEVIKDRDRIIPWNERNAEGILRILIDNRAIEIHRIFGKTSAGDKTEVLDMTTGEVLNEYNPDSLGEQLLGVSLKVFEKTFWLSQGGVCFSGKDDELSKGLMNLKDTGDEEFSFEATLKEIEREKREIKAKDKRGSEGRLDRLFRLSDEKIQERYRLISEMKQREDHEKRLAEEKKQLILSDEKEKELNQLLEKQEKLISLENRLKKWQQIEKLNIAIAEATNNEKYKRYSSITDQDVAKAEILAESIKTLDRKGTMGYYREEIEEKISEVEKKQKACRNMLIVGIAAVLLALVVAAVRLPYWIGITACFGVFGIILSIVGALKLKAKTQTILDYSNKLKDILEKESVDNKSRQQLEYELNAFLDRFDITDISELKENRNFCIRTDAEIDGLKNFLASLLDGEDVEKLKEDAIEARNISEEGHSLIDRDLKGELKEVMNLRGASLKVVSDLENKLAYVFSGNKNLADCQSEILFIQQEIEEQQQRLKAVELADEVLRQVYEKRRTDFTPLLNERVNKFLDILTNGRYKDARVSSEYRLRLEDTIQAEYLSRGAYEQIYLGLRLALSELIGSGDEPLFLDDFMTSYDDERSRAAIELLNELSGSRQILLFSCHGRDNHNAKDLNIPIILIEEDIENGC